MSLPVLSLAVTLNIVLSKAKITTVDEFCEKLLCSPTFLCNYYQIRCMPRCSCEIGTGDRWLQMLAHIRPKKRSTFSPLKQLSLRLCKSEMNRQQSRQQPEKWQSAMCTP
mmetsp:Transcript_39173/g.89001  ORF Transcript_39173/g.89001 Transcript_39173/m.89001 type:complete len:110 (-) Transcript_39173:611-940(-)